MSQHDFDQRPHRTLLVLSVPVLLSLIAEPLTGLVDTAFVSDLGDGPAAALGVGTKETEAEAVLEIGGGCRARKSI